MTPIKCNLFPDFNVSVVTNSTGRISSLRANYFSEFIRAYSVMFLEGMGKIIKKNLQQERLRHGLKLGTGR